MLILENSTLFSLGHMQTRLGLQYIFALAHRITKFNLGKGALAFSFPMLDKDIIRVKATRDSPQVITPLAYKSHKFKNIKFIKDPRLDIEFFEELGITHNHVTSLDVFQTRVQFNNYVSLGKRQIRNLPTSVPGCFYYCYIYPNGKRAGGLLILWLS